LKDFRILRDLKKEMKNNKSTLRMSNQVNQERDSRLWWRCLFGLFGGILLAAGFVLAAGKHFDALQCSTKNVELREKRERLKTERQRLLMERETSLSPIQLEKSARRIGLQNVNASQINRLGETLIDNTANLESEKPLSNEKAVKTQTIAFKTEKARKNQNN
jgi:hypothetical protein